MSKLFALAILIAVTWVATMFVWGVVQDRESRQREVSAEISEQWSRPQTIAGPVITIPVEKITSTPTGEPMVSKTYLTLLPENLSYDSQVETQSLARGIYEAPVYTSVVKASGNFDLAGAKVHASPNQRILWDQAVVSVNVSDTRGISETVDLVFGDKRYGMQSSSKFSALDGNGVHTPIKLDQTKSKHNFSFELSLKGSQAIRFLPLGENTEATISSNWNAPDLTGEFSAITRTVTEDGFTATWKIASYGKSLPQSWLGSSAVVNSGELLSKSFGVSLHQEVDFYTMVNRATKYSILFITLTFLTFFMYEILAGLRIHPMQYLLVGLAIALFYLLLLSFAEVIGFFAAYAVAMTATTFLITGYCFSVLKAKTRAFVIFALLTALYGYLYILLQIGQYSLLFGSVLLFGVLATVMYITRNLDWYELGSK